MHALESEAHSCRLSLQVQFREKLTVCDQPLCIILSCLVLEKSTQKYLFFKNISNPQFLERNLFLSRSIRNKTIFDNKSVAIGIDVGKNTQEEEEMIKEMVFFKLSDGDFCEYLDSFEWALNLRVYLPRTKAGYEMFS